MFDIEHIRIYKILAMNITPLAEAYLRFLKLTSPPGALLGDEEFDANLKALFEATVMHWSLGKPLSVLETISQTKLGSPATLHKRLQRLIAQDFVKSEVWGSDKRTKFVSPTNKGLVYIDLVGGKMFKSLAPPN